MRTGSFVKPALFGAVLVALAGCVEGTGPDSSSFRNQYNAARNALEAGNYARANRAYAKLLPQAGPFESRIRLEYAHSLLREGSYAEAAQQASQVARAESGTTRSAAQSVLGTARHELGLIAINNGDRAGGKAHLKAALGAIDDVLKNDPDLDPLGALAGRRASIQVRLKALG